MGDTGVRDRKTWLVGLLWNALNIRPFVEESAARVFPEEHTPLSSRYLSKGEMSQNSLLK